MDSHPMAGTSAVGSHALQARVEVRNAAGSLAQPALLLPVPTLLGDSTVTMRDGKVFSHVST